MTRRDLVTLLEAPNRHLDEKNDRPLVEDPHVFKSQGFLIVFLIPVEAPNRHLDEKNDRPLNRSTPI